MKLSTVFQILLITFGVSLFLPDIGPIAAKALSGACIFCSGAWIAASAEQRKSDMRDRSHGEAGLTQRELGCTADELHTGWGEGR